MSDRERDRASDDFRLRLAKGWQLLIKGCPAGQHHLSGVDGTLVALAGPFLPSPDTTAEYSGVPSSRDMTSSSPISAAAFSRSIMSTRRRFPAGILCVGNCDHPAPRTYAAGAKPRSAHAAAAAVLPLSGLI